jgi:hypothetical protein
MVNVFIGLYFHGRYSSASEAPRATDPLIQVVDVEPHTLAVVTFSGRWKYDQCEERAQQLRDQLTKDGILVRYSPCRILIIIFAVSRCLNAIP